VKRKNFIKTNRNTKAYTKSSSPYHKLFRSLFTSYFNLYFELLVVSGSVSGSGWWSFWNGKEAFGIEILLQRIPIKVLLNNNIYQNKNNMNNENYKENILIFNG